MTQPKKTLPEGVTEEQLTQLKRKHGKVYPITIRVDGKTHIGLFRKPKLSDMSAAASLVASDPLGSADLVYNSCKLVVDPAMDSDDEVHVAALRSVGSLFRTLDAEVGEPFGDEA